MSCDETKRFSADAKTRSVSRVRTHSPLARGERVGVAGLEGEVVPAVLQPVGFGGDNPQTNRGGQCAR